jgi:AraC-like DNA-binding protein
MIFYNMERIFKNKQLEYFKDDLWNRSVAGRSRVMTPLYVERYCGTRLDKTMSSHDHWEFSAHISGSGTLWADIGMQIIPDMILLIPPGLVHRESAEHELDTIWLGFKAELPGVPRDRILSLKSPEMIRRIIKYWSFSSRNHGAIGLELDGDLLNLVGYFFRKLAGSSDQTPLQQAVEYFNEHYQETIVMADIAKQLNCSEGHFYRKFKDFTGETPISFLNGIRLKRASFFLLNSWLPVNKVAALCGFNDPYYFSRIFKKEYGVSPVQYRHEN